MPFFSKVWSDQYNTANDDFIKTAKSSNSKILVESVVTAETPFTEEYGFNELSKVIDFERFKKDAQWPIQDFTTLLVDLLNDRFLRSFIIEYVPNHRILSKLVKFDSIGKFELKINKTQSILYVAYGYDLNNLIKLVSLCVNLRVQRLTIIKSNAIKSGFDQWAKIFYQCTKFYNLATTINYTVLIEDFPEVEKINVETDSLNSRRVKLSIDFVEDASSGEDYELILLNNLLEKDHFVWDNNNNKMKHLVELTDLYNT